MARAKTAPKGKKYYPDPKELGRILRVMKTQGKTIVLTNGCFDLLHVGHVRALKDAASRGHILVVAINSDDAVRRLKGEGRPLQPADERAEMLCAIEGVAYVTVFGEDTADEVIRELRPDLIAKGTDYKLKDLPERESVEAVGASFVAVGDPKDHSTQALLERIQSLSSDASAAAKKKSKASKKVTKASVKKKVTKATSKKAGSNKAKVTGHG